MDRKTVSKLILSSPNGTNHTDHSRDRVIFTESKAISPNNWPNIFCTQVLSYSPHIIINFFFLPKTVTCTDKVSRDSDDERVLSLQVKE